MDRRGFLRTGAAASLAAAATPLPGAALERWMPRGPRPNIAPDGMLRLLANENPLGLSEGARQAVIDHIVHGNRYPNAWKRELIPPLAAARGVRPENVFVGAGSTEILQVSVQALAAPGMPLVVADPTFEDVTRYQRPLSYDLIRVPLDFRYAHDVERMRDVVKKRGNRAIVYFCNPNNPTGTLTPSSEIDRWIQDAPETVFFIMDEAYFEFVDAPSYWSALKWIEDRPNVLVTRTFSKIFGMAGMRLGYGMAHPDTAAHLKQFISQNSTTVLSLAAGVASLGDEAHIQRSLEVNDASRGIVHETLDELGLGYLPTHANFLMHQIKGDLGEYIARFRERGIGVGRPFPPMTDYNRLSFGLPQDMERWADTLRDFRARGWV
jgi:histidinol-phosphate aminotransferase